jgi:hypothetical protein
MATRGRPAFQPTDEQRKNVEVMVSLGITEEKICLLVREHFKKELETGATKLNAKVGHFMVATILGTRPPNGLTPIKDERVRGRLGELFLKARLGWRETNSNQHEGRKEERRPIEVEDVRRRIRAKIARLAKHYVAGNSGEPTET